MTEALPANVGDALRNIGVRQPSTIRPERKSSQEIQAEIRASEQAKLEPIEPLDIVKMVKDGYKTSEFWVAVGGGLVGSVAVSKGWIAESTFNIICEKLGAPYILGRVLAKFAPTILERIKK